MSKIFPLADFLFCWSLVKFEKQEETFQGFYQKSQDRISSQDQYETVCLHLADLCHSGDSQLVDVAELFPNFTEEEVKFPLWRIQRWANEHGLWNTGSDDTEGGDSVWSECKGGGRPESFLPKDDWKVVSLSSNVLSWFIKVISFLKCFSFQTFTFSETWKKL